MVILLVVAGGGRLVFQRLFFFFGLFLGFGVKVFQKFYGTVFIGRDRNQIAVNVGDIFFTRLVRCIFNRVVSIGFVVFLRFAASNRHDGENQNRGGNRQYLFAHKETSVI